MRALGVIAWAITGVVAAGGAENADSQLLVDFGKRVSGLMEVHEKIRLAMQADAARIRTSLRHAEPVAAHLQVNRPYPTKIPLQSSPPSLLANLPVLPAGLEYRLVGHALILRDAAANLVIDIVPDAIS